MVTRADDRGGMQPGADPSSAPFRQNEFIVTNSFAGTNDPINSEREFQRAIGEAQPFVTGRFAACIRDHHHVAPLESRIKFRLIELPHRDDLRSGFLRSIRALIDLNVDMRAWIRPRDRLAGQVGFKNIIGVPIQEWTKHFAKHEKAENEGTSPAQRFPNC